MKKIIELFNFLTIGAFLSTIILFIGDFFGFSLGINFQLLWRVLAGILAFTVLLNTGNIKRLLKISTTSKKFLLLSGLNLFLFALFLLFYPIFRFGSPFVWEDRIANFKAAKRIEITLNEPLKQNFQAKSNNLGTIGLRIISKDIVIEEEPEEATPSAELIENEETGAVQGINIGEGELDGELITGELDLGEPERIVFRIKEEEKNDYFYENTYELNQYWETNYFLFGFPVQYDSESKNYAFEIEKTKEGETNKVFLIEENSQGNFNFYPRYVYNLASLKTDWGPILLNISRKTNQFLEEKSNQFNLIFVFLLVEFIILVFLKKEQERFKEKLSPYLKYGFLIVLLLITISSLKFEFIQNIEYLQNFINNLSKYSFPLIFLTITLGFLLFYLNRDEIEKDLRKEKKKEDLEEPSGWRQKKNRLYLIGLVFIIAMFTVIKAPYFNTSFIGEHTMKYNTHVEPAKYMYERNSPFWIQRKYQADPVNNPQGIFKTFGSPPIIEWGLFSTYKLFPNNSFEFNTRLFTHFLGILILIFAYIFFTKWLTKTQSLLIVFLMAINPIINFISFVTVEDSLLLIFMFLSLIYLSNFIKSKNASNLFWAGLFFGIGLASKASLFLWLTPISLVLLAFHSKKLSNFLKDFGVLVSLSLIPIVAFRTSLCYLPTDVILSIAKFSIWIILFIVAYYLIKKYNGKLEKLVDSIVKNKFLFFFNIIVFIILAIIFLYFTGVYKLSNAFLTDSKLIFNLDIYDHMFNEQFKPYMTSNVFYLGLIGFVFSFWLNLKRQKNLFLSFSLGSLIYFILASKVIFFHNYYTGIIMIVFSLSVGVLITAFSKLFKNKYLFLFFLILIGLLVFPTSYNANIKRLNKGKDIESLRQVAQYLIESTKEDDIYIDPGNNQYLTILTNRAQTRDYRLDKPEVKNLIKEIGFSKTMERYNISYIVTTKEEPEYKRYVNLFTDEDLKSITYSRTDIILSKLGKNYQYFPDLDVRNELIEKYNIEDKFILEKEIGLYKFFRFVD
jgi:4-amino-4-deoxy-L-arabinose transferase-like glycosyltransferase